MGRLLAALGSAEPDILTLILTLLTPLTILAVLAAGYLWNRRREGAEAFRRSLAWGMPGTAAALVLLVWPLRQPLHLIPERYSYVSVADDLIRFAGRQASLLAAAAVIAVAFVVPVFVFALRSGPLQVRIRSVLIAGSASAGLMVAVTFIAGRGSPQYFLHRVLELARTEYPIVVVFGLGLAFMAAVAAGAAVGLKFGFGRARLPACWAAVPVALILATVVPYGLIARPAGNASASTGPDYWQRGSGPNAVVSVIGRWDPPANPPPYRFLTAEQRRLRGSPVLDGLVVAVKGPADRPDGAAAAGELATEDGLRLSVARDGTVTSIWVGGQRVTAEEALPLSGFLVRDVARRTGFERFTGEVQQQEGALYQKGNAAGLDISLEATLMAGRDRISVSGTVRSLTEEDRAVTIYFVLPAGASGWQWWHDPRRSSNITPRATEFSNGSFIGRMGATALYPVSTVSGPTGSLSYSVRLDEPRVVRMGYSTTLHLYYIAFDLGLSPAMAKSPGAASFSFTLFSGDAKWGLRDALARYYEMNPDLFFRRADREGTWLVATRMLADEPALADFGITFHHAARDLKRADELGVYSGLYIAMNIKVFPLFDAKEPPDLRDVQDLIASVPPPPGCDGSGLVASVLENESGKPGGSLQVVGWFVDRQRGGATPEGWTWALVANLNPDPDIPCGFGSSTEAYISAHLGDDPSYDAVSFDGVSTDLLDYRRGHFQYADHPLAFDRDTGQVAVVDAFSDYEFLVAMADKLHAEGRIVMANGVPAHFMFPVHVIDAANQEVSEPPDDDKALLLRSLMYQKPASYMLKADFSTPGFPEVLERDFRRALFYGIYITAFNVWGGGEDTNLFNHPEWYEKARYIFAHYVPIIREVSEAGWQPLTFARSDDADVWVERFGSWSSGDLTFTLLNTSGRSRNAVLTLDKKTLGIGDVLVQAEELLSGVSLPATTTDHGSLTLSVPVESGDTAVVRIRLLTGG